MTKKLAMASAMIMFALLALLPAGAEAKSSVRTSCTVDHVVSWPWEKPRAEVVIFGQAKRGYFQVSKIRYKLTKPGKGSYFGQKNDLAISGSGGSWESKDNIKATGRWHSKRVKLLVRRGELKVTATFDRKYIPDNVYRCSDTVSV